MKLKKLYLFFVCLTIFTCISLQGMDPRSTISPQDFFTQLEQCTDWPTARHTGMGILAFVTPLTCKNIMQYCMTNETTIQFGDLWTCRLLDFISYSGKKYSLLQEHLKKFYADGPLTLNQTAIDQLISYMICDDGERVYKPRVPEHMALAGLKFLYAKGVRLTTKNLATLATSDKLILVEWLLQHNHFDPNCTSNNNPILHDACQLDMVKLFIRYGNTQIQSVDHKDGNTILHSIARHTTSKESVREWISYFTQQGADIDARNNDGLTPLDLAIEYRNKNAIAIFTEAGAKYE